MKLRNYSHFLSLVDNIRLTQVVSGSERSKKDARIFKEVMTMLTREYYLQFKPVQMPGP